YARAAIELWHRTWHQLRIDERRPERRRFSLQLDDRCTHRRCLAVGLDLGLWHRVVEVDVDPRFARRGLACVLFIPIGHERIHARRECLHAVALDRIAGRCWCTLTSAGVIFGWSTQRLQRSSSSRDVSTATDRHSAHLAMLNTWR